MPDFTPYDIALSYCYTAMHEAFSRAIPILSAIVGIACVIAVVIVLLALVFRGHERNLERDRLRVASRLPITEEERSAHTIDDKGVGGNPVGEFSSYTGLLGNRLKKKSDPNELN